MKVLRGPSFDNHRVRAPDAYLLAVGLMPEDAWGDDWNGFFQYGSPANVTEIISIIASSASGWDHVSVSLRHRCPTWAEMEWVKRLFFKDNEVAFQLHVKPVDHINFQTNTLHIWRPHKLKIPLPPAYMV